MASRVVLPAPGVAELEDIDLPEVGSTEVRVRSMYSLISSGTEGLQFRGRFDGHSHWGSFVRYPYVPGYATVARVDEVGSGVVSTEVGDIVAVRSRHASESVVDEALCTRVPASVALRDAPWFALAKIALMGARVAQFRLGDSVAVIGAGPIGQMSVRWAVAAGCSSVIAVDPVEPRLRIAKRGGASAAIAGAVGDVADKIVEAGRGSPPRVVIDTTGNAAVFSETLRVVADRGTVVLIGDTGFPTEQHLTSDVLTRGLTIVGAHDNHSGGWENDRALHLDFFNFVESGRFSLEGLTTHTFKPDDCQAAFETATSATSGALGVAFDWGIHT